MTDTAEQTRYERGDELAYMRWPHIYKVGIGLRPEARIYSVPVSLGSDARVRVDLFEGTCACPDPHPRCEHIVAAEKVNYSYAFIGLP